MKAQNVVTMGVHVLDVLVRPVEEIPERQGATLVEDIRMTAAGTAAGTALTLAKLGASVRTAGAIGTDPTGDLLTQLLDKAGIDTELLVRRIDTSTSATVLPIRPNGDRPTLHLLGANITYGLDDALGRGRRGEPPPPRRPRADRRRGRRPHPGARQGSRRHHLGGPARAG